MCKQSILDNIVNIFMFVFVTVLTIIFSFKQNKIYNYSYIALISFLIFQLVLCNLIIPCSGTSITWNAQSGFLLSRTIFKDKKRYNFKEKNLMIGLIVSFVIVANLFFIKKPLITHIAHILSFIIGFSFGLI
tara:strand:+ start:61 stop:456 length:396 start_codon:yes stop_codon:yes gene_type:complete